jgi:hypothetical protein
MGFLPFMISKEVGGGFNSLIDGVSNSFGHVEYNVWGYIRWMCVFIYFILFLKLKISALRHVFMFELVLGGYRCLGGY